MKKQIVAALVVGGVVVGSLAFVKYLQISKAIAESQNFAPPPEAVTSVVATKVSWPRVYEAIGSLTPVQGVTLSTEEAGTVTKVAFESGASVTAGSVLVELDTQVERADLAGAAARLELAKVSFTRAQSLRKSNTISVADFDNAVAQFKDAEAAVASLQARIDRKTIEAPFAGTVGIRMVNVGQYVAAGTAIVPLHSLDTLYADFSLPQQALQNVGVGQKVQLTVDGYPGQQFDGLVTAVNPQVEQSTRNVWIQATVHNQGQQLRPGMFTKVTLVLPTEDQFIAIPGSSINYAPYGNSVYVIERQKAEDGSESTIARLQDVRTGVRRGDLVAVTSGLSEGQEIISSGVFKIRPGAKVAVNNSVTPAANIAPLPADT